jgi:hypothetical protein
LVAAALAGVPLAVRAQQPAGQRRRRTLVIGRQPLAAAGVAITRHMMETRLLESEAAALGYDITIAVPTFTKLPDVGSEVRLRIHTHVREDALSLYGFLRLAEKHLFENCLTIPCFHRFYFRNSCNAIPLSYFGTTSVFSPPLWTNFSIEATSPPTTLTHSAEYSPAAKFITILSASPSK